MDREIERMRQELEMRNKLMLRICQSLVLRKMRGDKKAKKQLTALLYGASLRTISRVGKSGQ